MAKWQGTQVPNTGYMDKLYVNTNLSVNEVVNILNNVDYTENEPTIYQTYPVIANSILVLLYVENFGDGTINIEITSGEFAGNIFNTESGWNEDFNGIIEFDNEAVSQIDGGVWGESDLINVGTQNNLLTELFSITPFTQSQQTTADKLQKLIDGKQYVVDKTNAKAGTSLNIKSKWEEIGNVIERIKSGGSALIKGDWQGTTVPNSGYVEKVYFNTNLSVEEVVNILNNIDYTIYNANGMNENSYNIFYTSNAEVGSASAILKLGEIYAIAFRGFFYFCSKQVPEYGINFAGWNPEFNGLVEINGEVFSKDFHNNISGEQNDKLTSLVSITPFEQESATLSGEYDGSTLTITELPSGKGTVVPNSGYVDKVYFNDKLTHKEYLEIVSKLTLQDLSSFGLDGEYYIALSNVDASKIIVIKEDRIWLLNATSGDLEQIIYDYNPSEDYYYFEVSEFEFNGNAISSFMGLPVGVENDILSQLFSTTPFVEPNTIDIKSLIENDKRIPLQIKLEGIGGSDIVIPSVSNLVVSDKGVASWDAPVLSLPSGYQYSLSYLIKLNGEEVEELTTTSIDLSTYLVSGTNIISVIVKATITNNNESSINYEYSKPRYEIVTLSTTLPSKISSAGSGIVGTNIYLFGGNGNAYNTLKFDTTTETITTLEATFTQYINSIKCIVNGTNIYLFGGGLYGSQNRVNTIYKFDTTTETLSTLETTLPTNLNKIGIAKIESNVYIFGGATDSNVFTNKIYKFDLKNETISTLETTLPINIYEIEAKAIGTNIYLFGGITDSSVYINTIYKFDSLTETLTTLNTTLPTNACDIGSALIGKNIYLFGGETSTTTNLKTILKFDTTNETLTTLNTTLPTKMSNMVVEVIEKEAYILGGTIDRSSTNSILKFIE